MANRQVEFDLNRATPPGVYPDELPYYFPKPAADPQDASFQPQDAIIMSYQGIRYMFNRTDGLTTLHGELTEERIGLFRQAVSEQIGTLKALQLLPDGMTELFAQFSQDYPAPTFLQTVRRVLTPHILRRNS